MRNKMDAESLSGGLRLEAIQEGLNAEEAPICQFQQSNMIDMTDNTASDIFPFFFKKHFNGIKATASRTSSFHPAAPLPPTSSLPCRIFFFSLFL